jgi:zinc transport system substrate-binding protein
MLHPPLGSWRSSGVGSRVGSWRSSGVGSRVGSWRSSGVGSRLARLLALSLALAGVAYATAGCGGDSGQPGPLHAQGPGRSAAGQVQAAPISVVASAYPLAQLISYLGGPLVRVTNLVPPGVQPEGLRLGTKGLAALRSAQLVVVVGDGYQPSVEAAAAKAKHHLAVLPAISGSARPYEFWLDPALMSKAAHVVSKALAAADPAGRRQFRNGWLDFQSVASSLESDFYNTFTTCSKSEIVTSDAAFGRMASDFGMTDVAVSAEGVAKAVAFVKEYSLSGVFSEDGVPPGSVEQVAARAHVGMSTLDPLELTPSPGSPHLSYFSEMERNLSVLEGHLSCDTSENFS